MHPSEALPSRVPDPIASEPAAPELTAPRPIGRCTGVVAAIPARWGSTRLPGKPLRTIAGRPMIEHVYRRAAAAPGIDEVVVLTDDERIAETVEHFGGLAQMTPADCASGTDRIAWAARGWRAASVVNVQGDEPLIDPEVIGRIARWLAERPGDPVVTCAAPAAPGELEDPNAVKVVLGTGGTALYFSRAAIPYPRRPAGGAAEPAAARPLKHLGIYGYQRRALLGLAALAPTPLETAESLEQLRALEHGIPIRVLVVARAAPGVDTAEDLDRVEALVSAHGGEE